MLAETAGQHQIRRQGECPAGANKLLDSGHAVPLVGNITPGTVMSHILGLTVAFISAYQAGLRVFVLPTIVARQA
jgi:hypothetical protein